MITRMVAAAARAFLVALLIAMPAVILPGVPSDTAQIAALLSLVAATLTFVEYMSDYPSLIEFRSAPPFNRMRFVALFATVMMLTLINRGLTDPTPATLYMTNTGSQIGQAMDFPFSPVRLVVLSAGDTIGSAQLDLLRTQAGLAYLISLVILLVFVAMVRLLDWPIRRNAFNFFVNLPLFDPTAGGDVLHRLKRDSNINVALGFLLPFLLPAGMMAAGSFGVPLPVNDPMTMIWIMSAWAFLPASLIMRGVALMRIADLIEEKRRRAYAQADLQAV